MTQTTILDVGTDALPSLNVVLGKDEYAVVGVFSTLPAGLSGVFEVVSLTPGAPNPLGVLTNEKRSCLLYGPATYKVLRPKLSGTGFGVYKET